MARTISRSSRTSNNSDVESNGSKSESSSKPGAAGVSPKSTKSKLNGGVVSLDRNSDNSSLSNVSNVSRASRLSRTSKSNSVMLSVDSSFLQFASSLHDEVGLPDGHEERQADLCCGFCCDLRRACMVCDVCDIVLTIMLIALSLSSLNVTFINTINFNAFEPVDPDAFDDDQVRDDMERMRTNLIVVTSLLGCGIAFSIMGIYGAWTFNRHLVLVTAIWFCIDIVRSAVTLQWVNTVVTACFAYPHFALFFALKKQQITKENYAVSEQHCCCECCIGGGN